MTRGLMPDAGVEPFFQALAKAWPHPQSDLVWRDPFTLLVAVVLSAQSTDKGVNRVTPALFEAAPDPAAMVRLGEEGVRDHIRTLGLFRAKARHLVQLSRKLLDQFDGQVPCTRKDLESLPGVGRKTANVVLNVAFDEPVIPVDTHIFRVACRTGLAPGSSVRTVEDTLMARVPEVWKLQAHHLLILHGRYTCKARKPLCATCPVRTLCREYTEG